MAGTTRRDRDAHLFGPGPKRILALDGGGIRGVLTLQLLRRLEEMVRERTGDPSAVLSDYFDLVGGTSTGAIIASALACGRTVDHIDEIYHQLGDTIFEPNFLRRGWLRPKFPAEPLRESLEREFGEIRIGGSEIRTGLAIVAKRLDTGSPWVVHNNPKGRYFERKPGSTAVANKEYLLREVVRASTAAPTYFEPEKIRVADGLEGAFIDGGVSPHNNPALQLLMLATLGGHGLRWPTGAERLLLVSLGTGGKELDLAPDEVMSMPSAKLGMKGLLSLMDDASQLNEQLLQWMSRSPTARVIDSEVGDLAGDVLGAGEPVLSYLRYDVQLEREWLHDHLGFELDPVEAESIHAMERPENVKTLDRIGRTAALRLIEDRHFPKQFDVA